MNQVKLFIGSSLESLSIANALQYELRGEVTAEVWNKCFLPGQYTLDELKRKAKEVHFAIFILGREDKTESRGDIVTSPRDNVVYEAGLFSGHLGVDKVFLLVDARGTKIPTDWKGLGYLTYDPGSENAVVDAAIVIRKIIDDWRNKVTNSVEQQIQGYWWDFVLNGDEGSVIGLKKISCSPGFIDWKITGEAWGADGQKMGEFESTIASFDSKENKLTYSWKGHKPLKKNRPPFFGVGELNFEVDKSGLIAKTTGHFFSTNASTLKETTVKSLVHRPATDADVEIARGDNLDAMKKIILKILDKRNEILGI